MIGHPKLLTLHQCQRIRLQSTPVNVPSYNIGPGSGCVVVEQGIGNPFSKLKGFGGDDFHKLQFRIVSIALKTFVDQLNAERQGRELLGIVKINLVGIIGPGIAQVTGGFNTGGPNVDFLSPDFGTGVDKDSVGSGQGEAAGLPSLANNCSPTQEYVRTKRFFLRATFCKLGPEWRTSSL